jgi:hypothetical protein
MKSWGPVLFALSAGAALTGSCSGKVQTEVAGAGTPAGAGQLGLIGLDASAPGSAGGSDAGGASAGAQDLTPSPGARDDGQGGMSGVPWNDGGGRCQASQYTSLSGPCDPVGEFIPFKAVFAGCQLLGGPQTDCANKTCVCTPTGWWCGCPCDPFFDSVYLATRGISCTCVNDAGACSLLNAGVAGAGGTGG